MSSISTSDNTYRDFSSRIGELEDELRSSAKRSREKQNQELENLRKSQQEALRKQEADYTRTIARAKESANENAERAKNLARSEQESRKRDIYDKHGRVRTGELEGIQQEIVNAREDYARQMKAEGVRARKLEQAHARRTDELEAKHARELDETVSEVMDSSRQAASSSHANEHVQKKAVQEELERRFGEMSARLSEDRKDESRRNSAEIERIRANYDSRLESSEEARLARTEALDKAYAQKAEAQARQLRDSHAGETNAYRKQIQEMSDSQRNYVEDHADGRADAIREVENDFRTQGKVADELYRRELDNRQRKTKDIESYYARVNDETLKEKDRYYSRLIAEQRNESHGAHRDAQAVYEKNIKQSDLRNRLDRKQADQAMEQQGADLRESFARDMDQMARTYQETARRETSSSDAKNARLQSQLQEMSTTDQVGAISSAAENRIREQVSGDFNKSLQAEVQRDDARAEHLRQESTKLIHGNLAEYQMLRADSERRNAAERQSEKGELLQTITDTVKMRDIQLREREATHQREIQKMESNFARSLDQQRRSYEEVLQAARHDAETKLTATRQDFEFKSKMAQRAFSQQQNELIRGYEKKLTDQKVDYEALLHDTTAMSEQRIRETERRSKQALEEQAKGFEQRIAQTAQQFQERERLVTANHEEEMDKVRRSNALLIRKKS